MSTAGVSRLGLVLCIGLSAVACKPKCSDGSTPTDDCKCSDGTDADMCSPSSDEGAGGSATVTSDPVNVEISTSDDTPKTCQVLELSETTSVDDMLGGKKKVTDNKDYFCFDLEAPARVTVAESLNDIVAGLWLETKPDEAYGTTSGVPSFAVDLDKGPQLLNVRSVDSCCGYDPFDYHVQLDIVPYSDVAPLPELDPKDAVDAVLTVLDEEGFTQLGGFVGLSDPNDYFLVEVPEGATLDAQVDSKSAALTLSPYDSGDLLTSSPLQAPVKSSSGKPGKLKPLTEGSYLLRIQTEAAGAVYELSLSQTVPTIATE